MRRINVDHLATTPLDHRARAAMLSHLGSRQANASSLHGRGIAARAAVEAARGAVAGLLGCPGEEILFVGSATEANNLAIKGIALAHPAGGRLVAAATEHLSILHPLRTLAKRGHDVVLIPVDRHGRIDPDDLDRALAPGAILVSIAQASPEIGTVQPTRAIARIARARGVPLHVDATASCGHLGLAADEADLVTIAPHLFYGPQGTAALRVRSGISLRPIIEGGTQEGGIRPGTEAVAALAGFGEAARRLRAERPRRAARAARLAARFRSSLVRRLEGLIFTGHPRHRIPGHVSLCVRGIEAEAAIVALDTAGIEAASGSPCTTGARRPSHVLEAIGVDPILARGALTFTFGEDNREEDAEAVARGLAAVVERLRRLAPGPDLAANSAGARVPRPDGRAISPPPPRRDRGRRRSGSSGGNRSISAAGGARRASLRSPGRSASD
jgi:cysteine desulfurase